jgi:2,4-dienoyl-CoA reductase-like NADH-dependent reductase (Old Yellow Enzyme family)
VIAGVAAITWPEGACNPNQAALSDDRFLPDWEEFARRCHRHGAKAAAQLQHASKVAQEDVKAGRPMWVPSVLEAKAGDLFAELTREELAKATSAYQAPGAKAAYHVMTEDDVAFAVERFADAAARAQRAGLDGVELHAGHGYQLSAFLSPASNRRTDRWGGSLENRARLLLELVRAVRAEIGEGMPLFVRFSATDWTPGGWDEAQTATVARWAQDAGADFFDISTGGLVASADIPIGPGYQAHFAEYVGERSDAPVSAVGRITNARHADDLVAAGRADAIMFGKAMMRDPHFALRAAHELGADTSMWPLQYLRARPQVNDGEW